jgi:putative heme-binding domain-containing protein
VAHLSAAEREELKGVLAARPAPSSTVYPPRPFVKQWTLDELAALVEKGLAERDFDRGRRLFGEAKCFGCHRFNNEGGALAPDLTVVSGRYSVRDLLDKIVNPNKAISDQYAQTLFTLKDGKVLTGRIVNMHGDSWSVQTDMLSPARLTNVKANNVESMELSKVSAMPTGLLDTFQQDEIVDLAAYVMSRGNRQHEAFKKDNR